MDLIVQSAHPRMRRFFSFGKRPSNPPSASAGVAGWQPVQTYPAPDELTRMMPDGSCVLDEMIGMGGMGAVYRGRQVRLDRAVAVKILHRSHGGEYAYPERFQREAQALARMSHPNIVAVHDFGMVGDYLYYVMEYLEGTDLHRLLAQGRPPVAQTLHVISSVCDALDYAHSQGLVHRDIKPANILIAADGRVKVADFGLAKRFDQNETLLTRTNMTLGTPDYAAPEQYNTSTQIDHRADIYALGVVFYQMLTGQVPRGAWQPPSVLAGTDPRLDAVIVRALMPDRQQRHPNAAAFKAALHGALTVPIQGAPPVPPPAPAGAGRLLILEDDSLLRQIIARQLRAAGFEITETEDGADTVRAYLDALVAKRPFDAVLLDLSIPLGMGGAEAMRHLLQADPGVRGIVFSGDREHPAVLQPAAHGFAAALAKPCDSETLHATVRQVLGRPLAV